MPRATEVPGGPTPEAVLATVRSARFARTARFHEGYDIAEVDAFLGAIEAAIADRSPVREMIADSEFTLVRMREGYDTGEVDAFLATVLEVAADLPVSELSASGTPLRESAGEAIWRIYHTRFSTVRRFGYRIDQVDALLDALVEALDAERPLQPVLDRLSPSRALMGEGYAVNEVERLLTTLGLRRPDFTATRSDLAPEPPPGRRIRVEPEHAVTVPTADDPEPTIEMSTLADPDLTAEIPAVSEAEPTEETPTDEGSADDASTEDVLTEVVSTEEPLAEQTPVEEVLADEDTTTEASTAEDAATEETAAEEAPTEEAATEESSAEDTATDETSTEEIPVEGSPGEDTATDEAPTEEAPTEEAPTEEAPTEEALTEEALTDEGPTDEGPAEEAPTDDAPVEEAPADETRAEDTATDETTADTEPSPAQDTGTDSAQAGSEDGASEPEGAHRDHGDRGDQDPSDSLEAAEVADSEEPESWLEDVLGFEPFDPAPPVTSRRDRHEPPQIDTVTPGASGEARPASISDTPTPTHRQEATMSSGTESKQAEPSVATRSFEVTMHAVDPSTLSAFWCEALGYVVAQGDESGRDSDRVVAVPGQGGGPRLSFVKIPRRLTGVSQARLDVNVASGLEGQERMVALLTDATRLARHGGALVKVNDDGGAAGSWHLVMRDPEDNEFLIL